MSNSLVYADSEAPIVVLSAKSHFEQLHTDDTKLYAHFLSKASHWGSRAVLRSVSTESEAIFDLIISIHRTLGAPKSEEEYVKALGGKQAARQYLEYASQFLSNLGNFRSFGDTKFIPRLPQDKFDEFVSSLADKNIASLYSLVREPLYDTSATLFGFENGQVSGYYIGDVTSKEADEVNKALADRGIMPENTKVEKKSDNKFIVHVSSALDTNTTHYYPNEIQLDDKQILVQFGYHSKEFKHIVENLKQARKHVANEHQKAFIDYYIESFETGSMNAHKNSQINWVKDIGPAVESNLGFIETYRDPSGVRGEWEGLVAMVNQDRTAKFKILVDSATGIVDHLPWDKVYEKDTFTAPDFTSLEVLTFAGSGVPAGINIPNYDDVRVNIGFKNVSLGNVLSANPKNPKKEEVISFIPAHLQEPLRKWRDDLFEVQVGLHELLGHGSGKLLQETSPGEFNFDRAKVPTKTYYKPTDTWSSLFGTISGSFEECRAELVAMYLILTLPQTVLPIFGFKDEKSQRLIQEISVVGMSRAGLIGLEFWDPKTKKWGQPHMQARFSILKCLVDAKVVSLKYTKEDYDDLTLEFNFDDFEKKGGEAIGDYLHKLHVLKSTGDAENGIEFYRNASEVTKDYSRFRDVVLKNKLPRKQLIQANTFLKDGKVVIEEYEESEIGMIESFYAREI